MLNNKTIPLTSTHPQNKNPAPSTRNLKRTIHADLIYQTNSDVDSASVTTANSWTQFLVIEGKRETLKCVSFCYFKWVARHLQRANVSKLSVLVACLWSVRTRNIC